MANWDARFAQDDYVFGSAPAGFVARQAWRIAPGRRVLSVAEGEGRNAVFLAELGARVTGFDGSGTGLAKARRLAAERGVSLDLHHADIADWDWGAAPFDAVLGVFFQFAPPPLRAQVFAGMSHALKPGGLLLLHGYALRQVGYGTGGPGQAANLWTLDLLRETFSGFEILYQADYDADLAEGTGHRGRSGLIDFVARKPAA
ncbi:SAM-dependent methyltransferase [Frigidibacter mobilis]|uniref:Type 11 methyltransferase n=1 Tax=Frigidibacter mobilis TaxID=1335048 RepID=A0A159Z2Z0_9RHOB|nr:class I SAM-dependent methyltransferase [Frigidibacter mobilis]AMY68480.1 type 11 methyltransferase [Frigidibacter mobilis]